jgi:hypothetical protein
MTGEIKNQGNFNNTEVNLDQKKVENQIKEGVDTLLNSTYHQLQNFELPSSPQFPDPNIIVEVFSTQIKDIIFSKESTKGTVEYEIKKSLREFFLAFILTKTLNSLNIKNDNLTEKILRNKFNPQSLKDTSENSYFYKIYKIFILIKEDDLESNPDKSFEKAIQKALCDHLIKTVSLISKDTKGLFSYTESNEKKLALITYIFNQLLSD